MIALPDQVYAEQSGIPLRYDFFRSDSTEELPVIVLVHGGGWISGTKAGWRDDAIWLLGQGFACVCCEYRLAPLHPFPAAINDLLELISHLRDRAGELKILPDKITAMGDSAGGNLASMVGLLHSPVEGCAHAGPATQVNAVVNISGISDLTDPQSQHFPIAHGFLEQYMGAPYGSAEDAWRNASPLFHVSSSAAPFFIVHGEIDDVVPVEQSKRLAESLTEAGVSNELIVVPYEHHGFTLPTWMKLREMYVPWIKMTLDLF